MIPSSSLDAILANAATAVSSSRSALRNVSISLRYVAANLEASQDVIDDAKLRLKRVQPFVESEVEDAAYR